jgi:phytoene synthase
MKVLSLFRASSFAPAFWVVSGPRRKALAALYAFARAADDAVDDPPAGTDPRAVLDQWRALINAPYVTDAEAAAAPAAWKPLEAALAAFPMDRRHLLGLLDGVARDLVPFRNQTAADMDAYCYGVASTVGLACLGIFGLDEEGHRDFAVSLGLAVQTVNVLRDVRPDALAGRVYLPLEDLRRFGVTEDDLKAPDLKAGVLRMLRFEAARARDRFAEARKALPPTSRRAARPAVLMGELYRRLLDKLERGDFLWGKPRPRLGWRDKTQALLTCLMG